MTWCILHSRGSWLVWDLSNSIERVYDIFSFSLQESKWYLVESEEKFVLNVSYNGLAFDITSRLSRTERSWNLQVRNGCCPCCGTSHLLRPNSGLQVPESVDQDRASLSGPHRLLVLLSSWLQSCWVHPVVCQQREIQKSTNECFSVALLWRPSRVLTGKRQHRQYCIGSWQPSIG